MYIYIYIYIYTVIHYICIYNAGGQRGHRDEPADARRGPGRRRGLRGPALV